jgi:regulator of sigma E protease
MHTLLAYFVAFGILVVFHELGHYSVARLCGVKVLRFSIGIGKVVFSRRLGREQTEWAISMLPLGGYVQMLDARDQDLSGVSAADLQHEFTRQSVWRRMAIVAAGPGANFLLAIVVFFGLYVHGIPEPIPRIHTVQEHTSAYDAGLRGGELITVVNGEKVRLWSEFQWSVMQAVLNRKPVQLKFEKSGDGVSKQPVTGSAVLATDAFSAKDLEGNFMGSLGLSLAHPKALVDNVLDDSPAMRGGLKGGDLIVSINGDPVADRFTAFKMIRSAPNQPLRMKVLRDGAETELTLVPNAEKEGDKLVGKIGAAFIAPDVLPNSLGPSAAIGKAARTTWDMGKLQVRMIGKMIIGEVSWKGLSGPWTIADYAEQSSRGGAISYLGFIALISISLGIMNLLPIPVLDGGLLLYYSLEVLTGRPVSARFGEIAQRAGIGILMLLMLVAVFNDIARHLT